MPPASRGILILRLVRHASSTRTVRSLPPRPLAAFKEKAKIDLPFSLRIEDDKPNDQPIPTPSPSENEPPPPPPPPPRNPLFAALTSAKARRWLWRLFFLFPPIAFLITEFPLRIVTVRGPSMAPYLNTHSSPELPETSFDRILLQKVAFPSRPSIVLRNPKFQIQRGQIVVFYAPHDPTKWAVKRVVGIPGDRVLPLPGYPGGDEHAVVVPYNHIWVEGDANSRDKTLDSNWYGPISQNLIIGFAKAVWTPWSWPWEWTSAVKWEEHDYPAKKSGRIEEDVVGEAKINPDKVRLSRAFADGTAERELAAMKARKEMLPDMMADKGRLDKMRMIYRHARWELDQKNPESLDVAQELVGELEAAFESAGLYKDGTEPPVKPPVVASAGGGEDDESEEHDNVNKKELLDQYLERQRQKELTLVEK
ncbi:hypothetical protein LTR99_006550 [Exophiala xenobiotica]|uniref:Mitochondrial inner membrane protease subunit 2 n=1 Tax=Vermiconidia calcicola TaxID=1690605 RepID=A0AAV9Q8X5_9PEZI|nr:hypothetical protein LTR92_008046 [Exophiala xenobiotica]KAK5535658.1 hypothetical protein LTR23_008252 [Chaetothyriales sp. CCFEE 6169]KAK5537720.1 hypothetical protein LTR25_004972 [Vermiconidia calcicola]KAK5219068.1 hypothetical protein LTR72_008250 [Exophiala xenobiotica]KAK5235371.1 hypothetical protein LTR47_003556 [Exophiala xenobiotica]